MRTTVDIPDPLYRQLKAQTALRGETVKNFLLEAIRDKLTTEHANGPREPGWKAVFGKADTADVTAVQRVIDEEFSRVDTDQWK